MKEKIRVLFTERSNPKSEKLDHLGALGILRLMNAEDKKVPAAITPVLPVLAQFIEEVVGRMKIGGRLFYVGAGTSGRIGILDASECPPTFGTLPALVQGLIAGGEKALFKAVEGAEDQESEGGLSLKRKKLTSLDCVVGLSASGRTPFVIGALKVARRLKAATAVITCNPQSKMLRFAEFRLVPDVGPEIVSGSTRLKCGTAEKLLLNMISTTVMVRLGRVKGNRMVDLIPKSWKLWERAKGMVMESLNINENKAEKLLRQASGNVRKAIQLGGGKL